MAEVPLIQMSQCIARGVVQRTPEGLSLVTYHGSFNAMCSTEPKGLSDFAQT